MRVENAVRNDNNQSEPDDGEELGDYDAPD